jgi:hypothetical protein
MKLATQILIAVFVLAIALAVGGALAARATSRVPAPTPRIGLSPAALEQGCVNQGTDRRKFGIPTCWLQRQLSWKSDNQPHMILVGSRQGRHVGVAWPPYLVYNAPALTGRWFMFRVGFRYDRVWRGYIFPTLAIKTIDAPLTY